MKKFKVYFWKNIPKEIRSMGNEKSSKNDYMIVNIFDSYEEMYNYVDKREKHKVERNYAARSYCINHVYLNLETKEEKYTPLCGDLYFMVDNMGGSIVSHECCHAVIGYFLRKIKDKSKLMQDISKNSNDDCEELEELFCYMLGSLVNQIYNYYFDEYDKPEVNNEI